MTKNTRWFTTLTLLDEKHRDALHSICKKNWKKYMIIPEFGKKGDNPHYHIYFESDQYTRGTRYNDYFKSIYVKNSIKITVKTIQTKVVYDTAKDFLSYYFFKESHNTPETVLYNSFSEQEITEIFTNRKIMSPKRKVLKFNDAPYIMYDYAKQNKINIHMVYNTASHIAVRDLLRKLISEGYIVHHLYTESKLESIAMVLYDLWLLDDDDAEEIVVKDEYEAALEQPDVQFNEIIS